MASAVLGNVEKLFQGDQIVTMEKAVSWLTEARRAYVIGLGSSYALAYNFWYVARMMYPQFILIPRHGSLPRDDVMHIGPDDVLFAMTFQPYRTEVLDVLRFASDRGAKTIGLSDSKASPVLREAALGLFAPTHTPQFFHSNAATTALLETLCALMASAGGDEVLGEIEAFNELRWQSGVYQH
jgi:DNA-binding MurR/RpiR family transcriptional regulator